jgi:DNA-directed RNA polymerase subunit RPC12/RpoP
MEKTIKKTEPKKIQYICNKCNKNTHILVKNINDINYIKCLHCNSKILHKIRTKIPSEYRCR